VLVLADTALAVTSLNRPLPQTPCPGWDSTEPGGRSVAQLYKRGQQLQLSGLKSSVHVSWYYFKQGWQMGKTVCPFTKALKASTITWWGDAAGEAFHALPNIASA